MSKLKRRITENGIDYILVGDYYCNDILIYSQIILVNTAVLIYTKKKRR